MGYDTYFTGELEFDEPLTPEQAAPINALTDYTSVPETPPTGAPHGSLSWWEVTKDGKYLILPDSGVHAYDRIEWLQYIIDTYVKPIGRVLDGDIFWTGDETADTGTIKVRNNVVREVDECHVDGDDWEAVWKMLYDVTSAAARVCECSYENQARLSVAVRNLNYMRSRASDMLKKWNYEPKEPAGFEGAEHGQCVSDEELAEEHDQ